MAHLKTLSVYAVGFLALGLVGCAHNQAKASATASTIQAPNPDETADKLDKDDILVTGAVAHFDFDRDQLRKDGQDKLQTVAESLRKHPHTHVRISGHADEVGTEEYNLALGQRRAEVAKKYLLALGVNPTQVDTISYGEEKPADESHTESAWANNRRDEVERAK